MVGNVCCVVIERNKKERSIKKDKIVHVSWKVASSFKRIVLDFNEDSLDVMEERDPLDGMEEEDPLVFLRFDTIVVLKVNKIQ